MTNRAVEDEDEDLEKYLGRNNARRIDALSLEIKHNLASIAEQLREMSCELVETSAQLTHVNETVASLKESISEHRRETREALDEAQEDRAKLSNQLSRIQAVGGAAAGLLGLGLLILDLWGKLKL